MTEMDIYEKLRSTLSDLDFSEFDVKGMMPEWDEDCVVIGLPKENRMSRPLMVYIYPEEATMTKMTLCSDRVSENLNLWIISSYDSYTHKNEDVDLLYRAYCLVNTVVKKLQTSRQLDGMVVNLHINSTQTYPPSSPEEQTTVVRCSINIEWIRAF